MPPSSNLASITYCRDWFHWCHCNIHNETTIFLSLGPLARLWFLRLNPRKCNHLQRPFSIVFLFQQILLSFLVSCHLLQFFFSVKSLGCELQLAVWSQMEGIPAIFKSLEMLTRSHTYSLYGCNLSLQDPIWASKEVRRLTRGDKLGGNGRGQRASH